MLTTIIPIYLKKVIQQTNDELQKTRDYYNFEKEHIILKING
jgi:hypothetical protein